MKKKLLALLLTLCLVLGLFPIGVSAAPRRARDTEFHIMTLDNIERVVRNYCPGHEEDEIEITHIAVHAEDETANGPTNAATGDYWWVQNIHDIIDDESVDAITITAKVGGTPYEVKVGLDKCQLHHDVGAGHITEIYLTVKLTYDPNGGTGAPVVLEFLERDAVNVGEGVTFTKENAVLLGFSEKQNDLITSSEQQASAGIIDVVNGTYRIDENTTLYAVWAEDKNGNDEPDYQELKYTVTYTDGVDDEEVFADEVHKDLLEGVDTPAYNNGEVPTRTGYKFTGRDPTVNPTVVADATYTAQWEKTTFTLTYDANGGEGAPAAQQLEKDKWHSLSETIPTHAPQDGINVVFAGWSLDDYTVRGKVFDRNGDPGKISNQVLMNMDMTVYAVWGLDSDKDGRADFTEPKYSVTYTDGVTDEQIFEDQTYSNLIAGDKTPVYKGTLTRDGYTFTGWTPEWGATVQDNITYTATWTAVEPQEKTITVYFAKGDGTWADGDTSDYKIYTLSSLTPDETVNVPQVEAPSGMRLASWNSQAGNKTLESDASISYTSLKDLPNLGSLTFAANYEKLPMVKVTINFMDGKTTVASDEYALTEGIHKYSELDQYCPKGYKITATGDFYAKADATLDVNVEKLVKDVVMKIRFMDGETFVSGGDYFLPEGVQNYSILEEYVPEGYKMSVSGDFMVAAGTSLDVPVEKLVKDAIVNIRFMDGDEFIAGGDFFFEKDASVKFGDLELPEGYELDSEKNNAESGFVARDGAQIIVHVKKISTTGIMNIRFMDGETFVAGGDYFLPLGVQNYAVLAQYVPEGYRMCVAGDFMVTDGGKLDVPVEKIPTTGIMNIRFMDGDEFVAGGDYFLPLGVQNYSILTKYVPEGYRMCVAGDFMVTDGGKLDVPVEKIPTTGIMNIRFVEESTDKFIAGGDYMLPLGVQNYSILAQYVPEGYRMCVAGDFMVTDGGKLNVPVEKIKEDTYTVTLVGEGNRAYGEGTYEAGETVTIYAGTKTGYSFDRWVTRDVTLRNADDSRVSFVMPAHDVTIRATWDRDDDDTSSSGKTYPIYIEETRDGEVESSHKRAAAGTTITLTVEPEDGSELVKLTVVDEDGDKINVRYHSRTDEYTFTMPASEVTVKAVFDSDLPFKDVSVDSWYYDAVSYVYRNGLMNGISATRFAPNAKLNRAMIAQVLYNLEGETRSYPTVFSDVADSAWYADAVNWAADKGIVEGYGNGKFGPEDNITREQMAAILYRYADYKGYDVRASARLSGFADENQVSDWAEEAMSWAVAEDLMDGKGNNRLDPTGTATRAEVATILMRFCETIVEA